MKKKLLSAISLVILGSLLVGNFLLIAGCSSKQASIIKVSSDGIASYSRDHRIDGERFQHYETLDSNVTFEHIINGHHFEVRDGNVTYNGKEITRPEGSTLKIKHEGSSIFTYVDDKLVQEVRIDE
jgi:hypothetical protein